MLVKLYMQNKYIDIPVISDINGWWEDNAINICVPYGYKLYCKGSLFKNHQMGLYKINQ